jgi:hypothetical protein
MQGALVLTYAPVGAGSFCLQVMAVMTTPLSVILGQSTRQVGGFITIAVMGAVGIYLK